MDLFGINPEGGITLSSGAEPTPRQIDNIMKACAHMVGHFAYQATIKKGLIPDEVKNIQPPAKEKPTLKDRKDAFYKRLMKYKADNPHKWPFLLYENFFNYWTEPGVSKHRGKSKEEIMRFEDQRFFDIGGRLKNSWKIFNAQEQGEMWKRHKEKFPEPQNLFQ